MLPFLIGIRKLVKSVCKAHKCNWKLKMSLVLPSDIVSLGPGWCRSPLQRSKSLFLDTLRACQLLRDVALWKLTAASRGRYSILPNWWRMRGEDQQEPLGSGLKLISARSESAQLSNPRFSDAAVCNSLRLQPVALCACAVQHGHHWTLAMWLVQMETCCVKHMPEFKGLGWTKRISNTSLIIFLLITCWDDNILAILG